MKTGHWGMSDRLAAAIVVFTMVTLGAMAQVGEVDHSFGTHGGVTLSFSTNSEGDNGNAIKVYPAGSAYAGKVVVAGYVPDPAKSNKAQYGVARLNADGTLDTSFGVGGMQQVSFSAEYDYCSDVLIQPDDKIVLIGTADFQVGVARFNADGSLDTSFNSTGKLRLAVSGTSDWACGALQKDGKILVGGRSDWYNSTVVRLNSNGTLDNTFVINLAPTANDFESVVGVCLDDGAAGAQNIYATGYAKSGTHSQMTAIKLNSAGAVQWSKVLPVDSLGSNGKGIALYDYNGDSTPEIVIGGDVDMPGSQRHFFAAVLDQSGNYFTGFNGTGKATVQVGNWGQSGGLAVQNDGKIVVGNYADGQFGLARFTTAGVLDTTFSGDGITISEVGYGYPYDFCLDNAGNILCIGFTSDGVPNRDFSIVRILGQDTAMAYQQTEVTQNTADIFRTNTGWVIGVKVCVNGATSPQNVTSLTFNTNGTINPGTDLASAMLYFTGTTATYSAANQFGSTVANPNGPFTFNGSQTLAHGDNHFWLVYTIKSDATYDNAVDAECTSVTVGGSAQTPAVPAPAGVRTVRAPYYLPISGDASFGDGFTNVTFAGIDQTSVVELAGYADFTSAVASVTIGSSYTFACTIGGTWPDYPSYVKVWIDWNQNFSFDDTGEEYTIQSNGLSAGPHTASIAVPADALVGNTRMRVVVRGADNINTPVAPPNVGLNPYGEAEDYTVTVVGGPEIEVMGNGVVIASGDTTPSTTDYTDFGTVYVPSGMAFRTYVVRNTGQLPLTISSVGSVNSHMGSFAYFTIPAWTVPAGGSTTFMIKFDPSASGTNSATFRISSDDIDEGDYSFTVQGYGNRDPVITEGASTPLSVALNTATDITLNATDSEGETLTWSMISQGAHGTASIAAPGTGASAAVTYTPTADRVATDAFVVRVTDNYGAYSDITVNVTINKGTPTVNAWPTASAIDYGQTLADSSLTGGSATVAGAFSFDAPTTVPEAGSYAAAVTFTPTNTTLYNTVAGTVTVTVNKLTPTVTEWPTAGPINYGQTLAASALTGGSASVAGSFAFAAPTTAPNAGAYSASVVFTPTDAAHYSTVTGSAEVTVNQLTPTVTQWPTATAIAYGDTLADSTLSGGSASVPGSYAFDAPTTAPAAGWYTADATFTPTDTTNYTTVAGTVSVYVNKGDPSIVTPPTASAITYGQTLADSTLSDGEASVPGTFAFVTPTTAPNAGTEAHWYRFTPDDEDNYNALTSLVNVTTNQATPTVTTWPTASAITYGQILADSTLSGGEKSVPGTFDFQEPTYAPSAGTEDVVVVFTPTDAINYKTLSASISITTNQETPSVTEWPTAATLTYGDTLADAALTGGSAAIPGAFAFETPTIIPNVGTRSFAATFTPTDAVNYATVSGTISVTTDKATPTVSVWPTPAVLAYGQNLGQAALTGGTASTSGTFAFDAPATILTTGTHTVAVTFTPSVTPNYNTVAGTVQVTVEKANPVVTAWPTAGAITVGQALSDSTLSGGTASVPGAFAFAEPSVTPAKGTYTAAAVFTPTDTANYNVVTGSLVVVVNDPAKITPSVVWPGASAITYGQPCSSAVLTGGTATNTTTGTTVPGTFAFAAPSTTPVVGNYTAEIVFKPANLDRYNPVTGTITVTVNKATPAVTAWPVAQAITLGQALSDSALTGGAANTPGSFAFEDGSIVPGSTGFHAAVIVFTPTDSANWQTVSAITPVAVEEPGKTTPNVEWPAASAITFGQTLAESTLTGGSANDPDTSLPVAGEFTFDAPDTTPEEGAYAASVVFTPEDTTQYNVVSGSVTVTVNPATNTAPELAVLSDKLVEEGQTLSFFVSATDADNDPLTLSAENLPSGATFNADNGLFVWTPLAGTAAVYTVTFNATDGEAGDTATVNITVNEQPADDTPAADVRPPVILAGPLALELSDHNAIIAWTTDEPATGEAIIWIDGQAVVFEEPDTGTLVRNHLVALSDLAADTEYSCRVASTDALGNGPVESSTFTFRTTQSPEQPTLAFVGRPHVAYTGDTLAGVEWETDNYSVVTVEYGTAAIPPAFTDSVTTNTYTRGGSLVIGALLPGTMYQVRVTATDTTGTVSVTSPVFTITTATVPDTTPPEITEGPIVQFVTHDHAVVYWVTNKPTTSTLTYGIGATKALSGSVNLGEFALRHWAVLTNLLPSTNYTLNCTVEDPVGNQAQGDPKVLDTPAPETVPAPAFTVAPSVSEIGSTSALLNWETDQATDAYAMLDDATKVVAVGELRLAPDHAFRLTALTPGTLYTVIVRARNTSGGETESAPISFTTSAADTTPPAFAAPPTVTVAANGVSAILGWSATEPAYAHVSCGLTADALTDLAGSETLAASGDLSLAPLTEGTTYYYKVTLTDEAGNPCESDVASFAVPKAEDPGRCRGWLLAVVALLGWAGTHDGGPCFIATAAYGTPMAGEIDVLRQFRDEWLLTNAPGTAFVDFYYQVSPSIADLIAAHPYLAIPVRLLLIPVILCAKLLLVAPHITLLAFALLAVALRHRRRRA